MNSRLTESNLGLLVQQLITRHCSWLRLGVFVIFVALATMSLRAIDLHEAYDIFLDEITYLFISESVAANEGVRLHGETFYLHPPAFFYVEGAYVSLFQPLGDLVQRVYAVRALNVLFAGASGALLFLIGRGAAGTAAGFLAVLIYALDPLSIRLASRNMLEVAAMTWVLAGLLIVMLFATGQRRNRPSKWSIVAAGSLFGFAMLTKDMMVFLTLLPLGICFVFQLCLKRRTALAIGFIAILVYGIHPVSAFLSGDGARFVEKKSRGLARLVGLVQETGFNRAVSPGLFRAVLEKLGEFGSTYLLFALGMLALLYLWKRSGDRSRIVSIWAASAYILMGYLIPVGTLESQFFYYLLVPALLATTIAAVHLFREKVAGAVSSRLLLAVVATISLIILWSAAQWVRFRVTPDNGYERVLAFVASEIPPEMKVAATSETAQFLLDDRASGPWSSWYTLEALAEHRPDYLIVSERQLEWDYGDLALPLLDWMEENGKPVFSFTGRTNEQLIIYFLPPASWASLSAGTDGPGQDIQAIHPEGLAPVSVFWIISL